MNTVISRNYHSRSNELKWLTRPASLPAAMSAAVAAIVASNVTFHQSTQFETGFGCSAVAFAESADWVSDHWNASRVRFLVEEGADRIHFDGSHFRDPDGNVVLGMEKLWLLPDGAMWAAGLVTTKDKPVGATGLGAYGQYKALKLEPTNAGGKIEQLIIQAQQNASRSPATV